MPINAPKIQGGDTRAINVAEGQTAITTVVATDADGDPINFKIVGGADKSKFTIDPVTGVLTFIAAQDFENPNHDTTYEVIVQAADGSLLSGTTLKDTQTITVTITDVTAVTINGSDGVDDVLGATATTEGDTLNGLSGNDSLNGGAGADIMNGGEGNDTYFVENAGDDVNENAGEGTDTVSSSINYTLTADVENLTLTGLVALKATGNELANTITGNAKGNTIDGGAGDDTMIGGLGNDIYKVDSTSDVVTEGAAGGTDSVIAKADFTLGLNVENLTLFANANPVDDLDIDGTGNALNNLITGNAGDNVLAGLAGNDTLKGGDGVDDMTGGLGNDSYYVDSTADVIHEDALTGSGTDTVYANSDYTLSANIEKLVVKGTGDFDGVGNILNNTMTGNGGQNDLSGGDGNDIIDGKKGTDTMHGGAGNDTYYVDKTADVVDESAVDGVDDGGTDTVVAYANHTLTEFVENLTLGGTALEGTGNGLANTIKGNSSANILSGLGGNDIIDGGSGDDQMTGGDGNDTFIVNAAGDLVIEGSGVGSGTDEVKSSVTIAALADNVENLTLTGFSAISGAGNALANVIVGNGAANTLSGGGGNDTLTGGSGNDSMDGGEGSDTYNVAQTGDVVVDTGTGLTDVDQINSTATVTLDASIENVTLTGTGAISATGNASDNVMTGNTGINTLNGMGGNDSIDGGSGNDFINGGAGTDVMVGGLGNDQFKFGDITDSGITGGNEDSILGFSSTDKIDVSLIDARDDADFQHFMMDDNDGNNEEGEIVMTRAGSVVTVELHDDADGIADSIFTVTVDSSIASELLLGNFIL